MDVKYIDDINIGEVNALETAQRHLSQRKEVKRVHARYCEEAFDRITANASKIGMRINAAKTQLLNISDPRQSDIVSHIVADGVKVESVETMKILGFVFGKNPNVSEHVSYCINKFNKSIWALIHLKRAGIVEDTLLDIYKVMLRPHLEYCSPVFSPMLTKEQSDNLERQQRRAIKIIFGFDIDYNDLVIKKNVGTLADRRTLACGAFAQKLVASKRFEELFPLNSYREEMAELRSLKKYKEYNATTNRLYRSPLFSMRRFLNDNQ